MSEGVRRWERGRTSVDEMLERNELQHVPSDQEAATRMLYAARTHLDSATQIRDRDPDMALAVAYDAARKALAALLETQGLRPTSKGGHLDELPPTGTAESELGLGRIPDEQCQ